MILYNPYISNNTKYNNIILMTTRKEFFYPKIFIFKKLSIFQLFPTTIISCVKLLKKNINEWYTCRWSDKLSEWRRGAGECDKHVLLDHVHVHVTAQQRKTGGHSCGSPWARRWHWGKEVSLLLSVGALHALLPRYSILHAPLDMEAVGRGQGQNDIRGHEGSSAR